MSPLRFLAILASGALFGAGLVLSTMVSPDSVLRFLRLQDAGLMLVMGGAVAVTAVAYAMLPRLRRAPLLGGAFGTHPSVWNRDTAIGSAVFGIGWGLCGVCPGPALAAVGVGNAAIGWALAGILAGAWLEGRIRAGSQPPSGAGNVRPS